MFYPIRLEKYDDEANLYELTDFTIDDLYEFVKHLDLSGEQLSPKFEQLRKDLNRFLNSFDTPQSA